MSNDWKETKLNEYNSGIPISKDDQKNHEYNSGIPISKDSSPDMIHNNNEYNSANSTPQISPDISPVLNAINNNNNSPMIFDKNKFNLVKSSTLSKYAISKNKNENNSPTPPTPENILPVNIKEFNYGIPISKQMIIVPKLPLDNIGNNKTKQIAGSYHTVLSIDNILNGDSETLKTLSQCLTDRGWVKIKYSQNTMNIITAVMNKINKWFMSTDLKNKLKYSRKLNDESDKPNPQSEYSYNRINGFKEGLRILTGDLYKIHYENNKYPNDIKDDILKINNEFDDLTVRIMKRIFNKIYNINSWKEFGTKYDVSILNNGKSNWTQKFSMLDFVNYFNDKEYIFNIRKNEDEKQSNELKPNVLKSEFNVFEHSDPGLFALSFSSTNNGLEMFDQVTKKWIAIGLNEGIWWNGKTASLMNKNFKEGKHRVKIDDINYKSRVTGWYEVSINKQLKPEIMKETLDMIAIKNTTGKFK
eukprot:61522_1